MLNQYEQSDANKRLRSKLHCRNFTAIIIILILRCTEWAIVEHTISFSTDLGAVINESGRGRMLSQRNVLNLYRLHNGGDDIAVQEIKSRLLETLEIQRALHVYLSTGKDPLGLRDAFTVDETVAKRYYASRDEGQPLIMTENEFEQIATETMRIIEESSNSAENESLIFAKLELLTKLGEILLHESDLNTAVYQRVFDAAVKFSHLLNTLLLISCVILLLLLCKLLFIPTVNFVVKRSNEQEKVNFERTLWMDFMSHGEFVSVCLFSLHLVETTIRLSE